MFSLGQDLKEIYSIKLNAIKMLHTSFGHLFHLGALGLRVPEALQGGLALLLVPALHEALSMQV